MLLRSKHILYALVIVVLVVFLDQITKYLVRISIDPFETISLLPMLNLVHVQNTGAAFGMFRSLGNTFFIVEVVRALAEEAGQLDQIGEMTLPSQVLAGGMRQVIERRLSRVPAEANLLLQLAAVAGRELDLTVLASAAPIYQPSGSTR